MEGLNESALLLIIATLGRKIQWIMMDFSLQHILTTEVMGELRRSNMLSDRVPEELKK